MKTNTAENVVTKLSLDPIIISIALELPRDFTFDRCGREIRGSYYPARDIAMEFADYYVKVCRAQDRCPLTNNPSVVRWAIEAVLARWAEILGWRGEIET